MLLGLLVPVDDSTNGLVEEARRRQRGIQKEPEVNQRCLSATTRAAIDRPIARAVSLVAWRQISGFAEFTYFLRINSLTLIQLFEQVSLVTPAAPPWCADMNQPDLLPRTPCPPVLTMCAAAWRARLEPSKTTQRRGTDSSQASIPPEASLCNRAHSSPPHYHSNRMRE